MERLRQLQGKTGTRKTTSKSLRPVLLGQTCFSLSLLLVQHSKHDEVLAKFEGLAACPDIPILHCKLDLLDI